MKVTFLNDYVINTGNEDADNLPLVSFSLFLSISVTLFKEKNTMMGFHIVFQVHILLWMKTPKCKALLKIIRKTLKKNPLQNLLKKQEKELVNLFP